MSVRLIAVLVVVVLLAAAQADPGWAGRTGVPVPSGPVVRGLAPLTVAAQDDNENENGNDNSADDDDDTDNDNDDDDGDGGDGDNSGGGDDDDNDDGDDGDNGDGDDDEDNDDGTDDDDDDNGNNADDDDDDNDNRNENDDGDDDNGNDNEADDLDNDNGEDDNDERVIAVRPAGPIAIATIPPPAPRFAPAPRPEPVVVEEPYLHEASGASEGGEAEVRIGAGKVVVRLFPWLGSGVTVTVRFADPATRAPISGGPAGDLVFVVEAHDAGGAPLAALPAEVNLNVRYDDGDVGDLDEEGLVISHLDPATSSWRPAPRLIRDTVTNFLAASITELGAYAVHAP